MTTEARSLARVRGVFIAAVAALLLAFAVQAVDTSASPLATEGPTDNIAFNVSTATDSLGPGSVVQFTVQTSSGVGLNAVTVQLCTPGLSGYSPTNFGYSGSTGVRCVKQFTPNGIVAGTELAPNPGATYRLDTVPFNGTPQTSGTFSFTAGTGSVTWFNAGGYGPNVLTCGPGSPCDMVVQVVSTSGTTYFKQTLTFAGDPPVTTEPPVTTTQPPVTTTQPPVTTTQPPVTTTQPPVTTTQPPVTTSDPQVTTTSTTVPLGTGTTQPVVLAAGAGGTGGSSNASTLAFTGASTRDLVSIALVLLAFGLFLLGERERRRSRP